MFIRPGHIGWQSPSDNPPVDKVELATNFAHDTKTGTLVTTGEDLIIEIGTEKVDID